MPYKMQTPQPFAIPKRDTRAITEGYNQMGQSLGKMMMGIQKGQINQAASKYLMSGGTDEGAAQLLSLADPQAYMQANQQLGIERKQQTERQKARITRANDLAKTFSGIYQQIPEGDDEASRLLQTKNAFGQVLRSQMIHDDMSQEEKDRAYVKINKMVDSADENTLAYGMSLAEKGKTGLASAKTEILPGGITVQAMPSGDVIVKDRMGNPVTGQARVDALELSDKIALERALAKEQGKSDISIEEEKRKKQIELEKEEASNILDLAYAGDIEATKQAGRNAVTWRSDISQMDTVDRDIARAIEILESTGGQVTGPIANWTGNWTEKAQELDSILKGLGIARLSNFKGSTSEREMAVAFQAGAAMSQDAAAAINRLKEQQRLVGEARNLLNYELGEFQKVSKRPAYDPKKKYGSYGADDSKPSPKNKMPR